MLQHFIEKNIKISFCSPRSNRNCIKRILQFSFLRFILIKCCDSQVTSIARSATYTHLLHADSLAQIMLYFSKWMLHHLPVITVKSWYTFFSNRDCFQLAFKIMWCDFSMCSVKTVLLLLLAFVISLYYFVKRIMRFVELNTNSIWILTINQFWVWRLVYKKHLCQNCNDDHFFIPMINHFVLLLLG